MNWKYQGLASTLRAEMSSSHLPIVVIENETEQGTGKISMANFKADGATGGGIAFAIVGDHENRPTDMTNVIVIYETNNSDRKKVL